MREHNSTSTNRTDANTSRPRSRRRLIQAVGALGATGFAGCLSGDDSNTTGKGTSSSETSMPAAFDSVSVGKYSLTVSLSNPADLQSVALAHPTDGEITSTQVDDETVTIDLISDWRIYSPGEFILEARTENSTTATYELDLAPKPTITNVEMLRDQARETFIDDTGYPCANNADSNVYTIENRGTGPAILDRLKAPFPEEVDAERNLATFACHQDENAPNEVSSIPVLAPGEQKEFSPDSADLYGGFRSQEAGATYNTEIGVVETASEEWFRQDAIMKFVDIGGGNRYPTYDLQSVNDD